MKNDLSHLNDSLHLVLDQLVEETDRNGEPLDAEETRQRIQRAGAVSAVAQQIIATGRLSLDAERLRLEGGQQGRVPGLLRLGSDRASDRGSDRQGDD